MKKYTTLFFALSLILFSYSCEKVGENDPAKKATISSPVVLKNSSNFQHAPDEKIGFMKNLKIKGKEANRIVVLEKRYMEKIGKIPKVDGTRDKKKVLPIFNEMREKIKEEVGDNKYRKYLAYKRWLKANPKPQE